MCLVLLTALINYSMMRNSDLTFLTNNVRGLQKSKRESLIEYFKSKFNHHGVLFLQETHSSIKKEHAWVNYFTCPVFFSHGVSNSCGVLIANLGNNSFVLNE